MTDGIAMSNAIIESIASRHTTKYYDPAATLSDDQIRELVQIGTTAPTSFHLQNWRFIAVRTAHAKRSEEHTSELQSLMRSSYAVFCLKKTKQEKQNTKK